MKQCAYCGSEIEDSVTICPFCSASSFAKKCTRCGAEYNGSFCPKCGLKAGGNPKRCPKCGAEYQSNACPNCGYIGASADKEEAAAAPSTKKYIWLWVLGWIFIFPVPLTILMLRNKNLNKNLRIGIIVAAWIVFLLLCIAASSSDDSSETERKMPSDEIALTFSSYDMDGQQYQDIVTRFQSIGLDNIELVPVEDLIIGWLAKDGEVDTVTIDGDDYFYKGEKVKKDALIRISYHTFPGKETAAETAPASDSVTEEITAAVTAAATERYTEKITERVTEPETETTKPEDEHERYNDDKVIKNISAVLGMNFDSSQYDVWIDGTMVNIQFTPEGITSVAYRASELGDKAALDTWNTLVSTARQWSKDLENAVHNDMNRSDLTVALYYCHDLNPDNVLLIVMKGTVYLDYVNGINRLS